MITTPKIKDVASALLMFEKGAKKHAEATETGDYKTVNKNYDLIQKAVIYLRENDGIHKLRELLTHSQASVRVAVASFLLKHFEHEAISVLEEIASKSFLPLKVLQLSVAWCYHLQLKCRIKCSTC